MKELIDTTNKEESKNPQVKEFKTLSKVVTKNLKKPPKMKLKKWKKEFKISTKKLTICSKELEIKSLKATITLKTPSLKKKTNSYKTPTMLNKMQKTKEKN